MRFLVLSISLWPLICCRECDRTWACVTLSVSVAILLHIVFSIAHQLKRLAERSRFRRWSH